VIGFWRSDAALQKSPKARFDPLVSPIVRKEAGRLRDKLDSRN
jgi:hypothetical protein